ncbi:MAG TPA: VOC family protein [Ignavibacteria bacterium]|nr:VOC family protein [Ignavibacteria bacterium]
MANTKIEQKIVPCIWYDNQAEEAVNFYVSIFKNSRVETVTRYGKSGSQESGQPESSIMTITFFLDGQKFIALNGGPVFKLSEAMSLMIYCKDQAEIDYFYDKLADGGQIQPCGWLKDKFGLSWQLVTPLMDEVFNDKDTKKQERVMAAIIKMTRIDLKTLEDAYEGK